MRQTEGDLRSGGLARVEHCLKLVGQEERKIDSHMHTAGQMRRHQEPHFSIGYVDLHYTHSYTLACTFLSSMAAAFFSNRRKKHLKRNSACSQILRVDDYPP